MRVIAALSVMLLTVTAAQAQTNYGSHGYGSYNPYMQRHYMPQGQVQPRMAPRAYPNRGYYAPQGNASQPRYAPQQQVQSDPADIIRRGIRELRTFLSRGKRVNDGEIARYVETFIAPAFDFAYMTRSALGPQWRRLDPARRNQSQAWLQQNFLGQLTGYVGSYQASRIDVLGARNGTGPGEVNVPVRVWNNNKPPVSLNFRFYLSKQGWRIFDVSANGQSAIIFYRGYINRMMRQ